jgi:hypothetical protein
MAGINKFILANIYMNIKYSELFSHSTDKSEPLKQIGHTVNVFYVCSWW